MAERDLAGESGQECQPTRPHGVDPDSVEQEDVPAGPQGCQHQADDKNGEPEAVKSRVQDGHVLDVGSLEVARRAETHASLAGEGEFLPLAMPPPPHTLLCAHRRRCSDSAPPALRLSTPGACKCSLIGG